MQVWPTPTPCCLTTVGSASEDVPKANAASHKAFELDATMGHLAESRMKDCFCGRHGDPASIRQYAKIRSKTLEGKRYRPDA